MGKVKYYAVRKGRNIGIYTNWDECQESISGYSNAEYKSFANKKDAVGYLNNIDVEEMHKQLAKNMNAVIAYVDGSYSDAAKRYSYGCILITPEGEVIKESGFGEDSKALSVRNVAGELLGAMYAVKYAYDLGYKKIIIRHDYMGISKWYTGEWKVKDEIAKKYIAFLAKYKKQIEIFFEKVDAHTGDKYNEEADQLAKNAIQKEDKHRTIIPKQTSVNSRELLVKLIEESIMISSEVIEFLCISSQRLSAMKKGGKLISIKRGIYLRIDVEKFKDENAN